MEKTWVQSLGWEDPLEEGMQPTSVFLPGKSHGQRSLAGYSPRGCEELDMNEATQHAYTQSSFIYFSSQFEKAAPFALEE